MPNVFTNAQTLRGSFRADMLKLSFGAAGNNMIAGGLIAQNVQFAYQQQITLLYALDKYDQASQDVYMVGGRSQGTAGIARILGPTPIGNAFLLKFGNVCLADTNILTFEATNPLCGNGGGVNTAATSGRFKLSGCAIQSLAHSVAAQDALINQQVQMMYVNLDAD